MATVKNRVEVSNGNIKIGKNTLIINITSATDCTSRKLGLCQLGADCDKCYALKAERQYPACLPYRRRQTITWDKLTADEIAQQIADIARRKHTKIKYLRFSESGDFRDQTDVDKIVQIARYLKNHNIKVYGYTARKDLDYRELHSNIVINGSGFMLSNQFIAVTKIDKRRAVCPGNCRICGMCKTKKRAKIQILYH